MSPLPNIKKLSQVGFDFIAEAGIDSCLSVSVDMGHINEILAKSLSKEPLELSEAAVLLNAKEPAQIEAIFETAKQLKKDVYGNRIVLFAPIYVGNLCVNDCHYCGFRVSNKEAIRRTLTPSELESETLQLLKMGHKRTILVFGEHANYSPEYIAECVKTVYNVRFGNASIRRANINAAPLDVEGYKTVKSSGIGTYQVFQETYHEPTYKELHPANTRKADFLWRLDSQARALEAGVDDVGIGALFGLADWRFDALSLIAHARHLMKHFKIGPHTISFPRIRPASGLSNDELSRFMLSDANFLQMIAVLRLSVPYTGLILTARETADVRREALAFGVSQIDAATRIEIGGYTKAAEQEELDRGQFSIGDTRKLDAVVAELLKSGYIPSFCTACYRLGRTGEIFMEYAIPGFIQNMCTPNAITTLQEYLVDFASAETRALGEAVLQQEMAKIPEGNVKRVTAVRLESIKSTPQRDLYF